MVKKKKFIQSLDCKIWNNVQNDLICKMLKHFKEYTISMLKYLVSKNNFGPDTALFFNANPDLNEN